MNPAIEHRRAYDHPDLRPDQCRISLNIDTGTKISPDLITPRWLNGHCLEPVVDDHWQICQRHANDRQRMIELDKKREQR